MGMLPKRAKARSLIKTHKSLPANKQRVSREEKTKAVINHRGSLIRMLN